MIKIGIIGLVISLVVAMITIMTLLGSTVSANLKADYGKQTVEGSINTTHQQPADLESETTNEPTEVFKKAHKSSDPNVVKKVV